MMNLRVPYLSQIDNRENPYGSCNVTSVAMVLKYYGFVGNGDGQFEDQLYKRMITKGWSRHSWWDLAKLVQTYPLFDNVTERGTLQGIRDSLNLKRPVILHGYFTRFGHIIVVYGYDATGFMVHDPYGRWTSSGYEVNSGTNQERGKALHYSTNVIARTCSPESTSNPKHIVMHSIGEVQP